MLKKYDSYLNKLWFIPEVWIKFFTNKVWRIILTKYESYLNKVGLKHEVWIEFFGHEELSYHCLNQINMEVKCFLILLYQVFSGNANYV